MAKKNLNITPGLFKPGVKVCRNCGTAIDENTKHCTNCGKDKFFFNYSEYLDTTYTYCAKCGTANIAGNKCCPECGSPRFVDYDRHVSKKKSAANKKKRALAYKIIFIVLSIIIAAGLFIFAIWAQIFNKGISWPGLLLMFMVYSIVAAVLILIDKFGIDDLDDMFLYWFLLIISIVSAITAIPLLCFKATAIYGFGIALSITVYNVAGFLTFFMIDKDLESVPQITYLIMGIISIVLLTASIMTVSWGFGWELYF